MNQCFPKIDRPAAKCSEEKVDGAFGPEGCGHLTAAGCIPRGETTHYILCVAIAPIKCVRCAALRSGGDSPIGLRVVW